ncbi:MAG: efflux RND transporter periplasmic adaptor subunit [candidate division Zixibacteria bacterium]|nr:efflux RND transporter periplasmic adaptor subunit [candidate division Zixibacteria bacterium]
MSLSVLLVPVLLTAGCGGSSNADQKPVEPSGAVVEAVSVVRQTLRRELALTGSLLPNAEATVSAEVSGRVVELMFDVQRSVRKGDVLLRLDDTEYRLQLAQARAALAQTRLTAERAEQDFARDTKLMGTGSVSQRTIDVSRTARDAAKAQLEAAEAGVTLAEKRLDDTTVRAPISGAITLRSVNVGDYLRAPQAIAKIVQTAPLKIQTQVPERFASEIEAGQVISLSVDAYPSVLFEGHVARVNPATDPATRTFTVEGTISNTDGRLKPGFFAKTSIVRRVSDQVLMIPIEAVVTHDKKSLVFVARNGAALLTPVELGDRQDRMIEALTGVTERDSVLVSGHTTLMDGARIVLVNR